jgi:uncharacterized membrane protein YeiB
MLTIAILVIYALLGFICWASDRKYGYDTPPLGTWLVLWPVFLLLELFR